MDLGALLSILFFIVLVGTSAWRWSAPDPAIRETTRLLLVMWAVSLFAVRFSVDYPIVAVALADLAAVSFILTRRTLRNWQLVVSALFAGMVACHIGFLANIVVYQTKPNISVYLNLLTMLFYGQISVVVWAKWQDARSDTTLGKSSLAGRIAHWAMVSREWYPSPIKKA